MTKDLTSTFQSKVEALSPCCAPPIADPQRVQFMKAFSKDIQLNIQLLHSQFKEHLDKPSLSEQKKDHFETELFKAIRSLEDKMGEMKQIVDLQFQNDNHQMKAHLGIMLGQLQKRLGKVGLDLQNYKLARFNQQNRHKKLIEFKPKAKIHKPKHQSPEENGQDELQQQNQELMHRLTNDQDQIKENQKKLMEISQLISKFSSTVAEQDQITDQISRDARSSLQNVEQANKHLAQASQYSSGFGQIWSYFFLSLAGFLLAYDYLRP